MRKSKWQTMTMWKSFKPVYDDPPAEGAEGQKKDDPPGKVKTFTQDEVNSLIAKERSKDKDRVNKLMTQLEEVKSSVSLTQQEKEGIEQQLETLRSELLTKEELSARERKKIEAQLSSERDAAIKAGKAWQSRYETATINRSLLDAAVAAEAFAPQQIMAILSPTSKVVEQLGSDGKPTGEFSVAVQFEDADKDGKPISLQLTPAEVVKRMKELPERFGNLFKSGVVAGIGAGNTGGASGKMDYSKMSPEHWKEHRKKLKEQGKL